MQNNEKSRLLTNMLQVVADHKQSSPMEALLAYTLLVQLDNTEASNPTPLGDYLEEIRTALQCPMGLSIVAYAKGIMVKLTSTEQALRAMKSEADELLEYKRNYEQLDKTLQAVRTALNVPESYNIIEYAKKKMEILTHAESQVAALLESNAELTNRVNGLSEVYKNSKPPKPSPSYTGIDYMDAHLHVDPASGADHTPEVPAEE
jgi:hypothetical protein